MNLLYKFRIVYDERRNQAKNQRTPRPSPTPDPDPPAKIFPQWQTLAHWDTSPRASQNYNPNPVA